MKPGITLTGADERTKIEDLIRLAEMGAEIGLLYTYDPEGRNRYPAIRWLWEATDFINRSGLRCAIHVCGKRARAEWLLRSELLGVIRWNCNRVQINGIVQPWELMDLYRIDQTIITQHAVGNRGLVDVEAENHAILVDASGGEGKLPGEWVRPVTSKPVGFAGGLNPDNLREQLPKIAAVAQGEWWIDMESGLRTDDWFDMAKALRVMEIWREFNDA